MEFKPSASDNEMNVTVFKPPRLQEHYIINHTEKRISRGRKFKKLTVTRNLINSAAYTEKLSFNFSTTIHPIAVMTHVLRTHITDFLSSDMKL